ncbi:MAG: hypothetical protein IOD05_17845 [Rhodobacter sp.]|nr:hypothetical protein [Rhodobacter sp.]MCA6254620.1 hypothetical protein [Phenylobacterium sp.]
MSDWINAVGGVMLLCIPLSLMLVLPRNHKPTGVWFGLTLRSFLGLWAFAYFIVLLFASVFFAGVGGVYLLMEAFR